MLSNYEMSCKDADGDAVGLAKVMPKSVEEEPEECKGGFNQARMAAEFFAQKDYSSAVECFSLALEEL
jgi:hypothetical protein